MPDQTITEREAVLRERQAFEAGVIFGRNQGPSPDDLGLRQFADAVVIQSRNARYPLPVSHRPYRARLSDGSVWSFDGGFREWPSGQWAVRSEFQASRLRTPDDFRKVARCLSGEMEPVPAEEEG